MARVVLEQRLMFAGNIEPSRCLELFAPLTRIMGCTALTGCFGTQMTSQGTDLWLVCLRPPMATLLKACSPGLQLPVVGNQLRNTGRDNTGRNNTGRNNTVTQWQTMSCSLQLPHRMAWDLRASLRHRWLLVSHLLHLIDDDMCP